MLAMWWQKGNHHIISECKKLMEKEYNTRNDWVGKVVNREL